ncbi:hypothetical protein BHE74_00023812 [Ensete ventricosum]|nr:hypothetical protein BHE74_00023812 [Ensete ventricosum]
MRLVCSRSSSPTPCSPPPKGTGEELNLVVAGATASPAAPPTAMKMKSGRAPSPFTTASSPTSQVYILLSCAFNIASSLVFPLGLITYC